MMTSLHVYEPEAKISLYSYRYCTDQCSGKCTINNNKKNNNHNKRWQEDLHKTTRRLVEATSVVNIILL